MCVLAEDEVVVAAFKSARPLISTMGKHGYSTRFSTDCGLPQKNSEHLPFALLAGTAPIGRTQNVRLSSTSFQTIPCVDVASPDWRAEFDAALARDGRVCLSAIRRTTRC